jgi:hypothetical protein
MNVYKPLFVKCACSTEAVEILRFNYSDTEIANDKGFYFSFWKQGSYTYPMSFKERLRWCWFILTKGKPFSDGVILTDSDADEIVLYLNNKN